MNKTNFSLKFEVIWSDLIFIWGYMILGKFSKFSMIFVKQLWNLI